MADNKKPVVRLAGQTRVISELGYDALSLWEKYGMVDQALRGQKSYERTFVPGESELTRRLLGLPEEFEYSNIRTADERDFKEENLKDPKMWNIFLDNTWKQVAGSLSYKPEESSVKEVGPNEYIPNPESDFGKNLQTMIDLAFSRAVHQEKEMNPDTGEMMYKGEEELLGDIYFDEEGNFEDIWDFRLEEREDRTANLDNLLRHHFRDLQVNVPVVRGKATYRGYE